MRATKDGINSNLLDLGKMKETKYKKLINEIKKLIDACQMI